MAEKRLGAYARHKAKMDAGVRHEQNDREHISDQVEAYFDQVEAALMVDDVAAARRNLGAGLLLLLRNVPDAERLQSVREKALRLRKIGLAVKCLWLENELRKIQQEEQEHG